MNNNNTKVETTFVIDITDEERKKADKEEEARVDKALQEYSLSAKGVRCLVNDVRRKLKAENTIEGRNRILQESLEVFNKLFQRQVTINGDNCQAIAAMDNMKWRVAVNKGEPIGDYDNPISYLAYVAYRAFDKKFDNSDRRERDRHYRQKKKSCAPVSLDEVYEDGTRLEIATEVDFDGMDARLQNFEYLTPTQKYIFQRLYEGYTKKDIAEQLGMEIHKLRTEIRQMAKTLTNPPPKELLEVTKICSLCKQSKPLLQFTKDKSKKGGYSCRCKECDRARKKSKSPVGNLTETA